MSKKTSVKERTKSPDPFAIRTLPKLPPLPEPGGHPAKVAEADRMQHVMEYQVMDVVDETILLVGFRFTLTEYEDKGDMKFAVQGEVTWGTPLTEWQMKKALMICMNVVNDLPKEPGDLKRLRKELQELTGDKEGLPAKLRQKKAG